MQAVQAFIVFIVLPRLLLVKGQVGAIISFDRYMEIAFNNGST